jgi:hypothetical protein
MHELSNKKIDQHVKKMILENYVHECQVTKNLPILTNLDDAVFRTMFMEHKLKLIEESIARHDDQLFGFYTREEFIAAALKQEFNDASLEPHIDMKQLCYDINYILSYYHLTFLNMHERHTPIVGVW